MLRAEVPPQELGQNAQRMVGRDVMSQLETKLRIKLGMKLGMEVVLEVYVWVDHYALIFQLN